MIQYFTKVIFFRDNIGIKQKKDFLERKSFSVVIRLGLEPKTPTLKVLCSTS